MRIGELAKASGLSAHTLRYYEKAGLFKSSSRSEANYRVYNNDDLATAKFIKYSKKMGFSLDDIQQFLSIRADRSAHVCAEAKQLAQQKIEQVQDKIHDLNEMLRALHILSDACCGGNKSAEYCSIIEALEGNKNFHKSHNIVNVDEAKK